MKRKINLAIETAIGGGSLAIFENSEEIDQWIGSARISTDVNLLSNISELLERNNLHKFEINTIVYSNGPGSLTGIRIGASIAHGLSTALGCRIIKRTVLEALTVKAVRPGRLKTAIKISKNQIVEQIFDKTADGNILALNNAEDISTDDFCHNHESFLQIVFLETERDNPNFLKQSENGFDSETDGNTKIVQPTENLAVLLALLK